MADEDDLLDDDLLDDYEDDDSTQETESSEPEIASADPVVGLFREKGFDIPDGISGDLLLQNIREMARRTQSMPSEMDLARMREAEARYQQDREPAKPEPQPEQKRTLSKPEGADQYVVFDEKAGYYVPKDARFPNLKAVEEMNSWHQQVESRRRRLLEDPEGYLKSEFNLDSRLEEVRKQARDEALQEFQRLREAEKREADRSAFWDKHAADLYVVDSEGYVVSDLMNRPTFSQKGLKYLEFQGAILQKYPNADPYVVEKEAFEMADKWEKNEKRRQARSQKPVEQEEATEVEQIAPEDVAESQKQSFARKARVAEENGKRKKGDRVINRDASVVAAARNDEPQNGGVDFRELYRLNAKHAGLKT